MPGAPKSEQILRQWFWIDLVLVKTLSTTTIFEKSSLKILANRKTRGKDSGYLFLDVASIIE